MMMIMTAQFGEDTRKDRIVKAKQLFRAFYRLSQNLISDGVVAESSTIK